MEDAGFVEGCSSSGISAQYGIPKMTELEVRVLHHARHAADAEVLRRHWRTSVLRAPFDMFVDEEVGRPS
jgi:hypothetical protein